MPGEMRYSGIILTARSSAVSEASCRKLGSAARTSFSSRKSRGSARSGAMRGRKPEQAGVSARGWREREAERGGAGRGASAAAPPTVRRRDCEDGRRGCGALESLPQPPGVRNLGGERAAPRLQRRQRAARRAHARRRLREVTCRKPCRHAEGRAARREKQHRRPVLSAEPEAREQRGASAERVGGGRRSEPRRTTGRHLAGSHDEEQTSGQALHGEEGERG